MGVNRYYESTGWLKSPNIAKTAALSPDSGANLAIDKVIMLNSSGGAANVGFGYEIPDALWKAGQWDASETPEYEDDTTDAQDAGTSDFAMNTASTNNDGFLVQSVEKFNVIGVTVGTAQNNGTLEWTYWNGTSWATLSLITTPDFTGTGDKYAVFMLPTDWAKGGDTDEGVDSDKYAVRCRATTAPSATAALATEIWLLRLLDYNEAIDDGAAAVFSSGGEIVVPYGASIVPYFSVANAANAIDIHYRPLR